jgi:Fe-Mn family superoxide dismutase
MYIKGSKYTLFSTHQFAQLRSLQTFSLPDLPYDYGALVPAISGEIMQLHHQKHHQAYITNYNKALKQLQDAVAKGSSTTVVKLQSAIKFNGRGRFPSLSRLFCLHSS